MTNNVNNGKSYEELIAENAALKAVEKIRSELDQRFEAWEKRWETREEKVLENLIQRIKPIIGEFKDRAVEESNHYAKRQLERIFNIDPANGEHIARVQARNVWTDKKMAEEDTDKQTWVQEKAKTKWKIFIILLLILSGMFLGDLVRFRMEWGPFFFRGATGP